jgi:D-alanine-D-alanine ligase
VVNNEDGLYRQVSQTLYAYLQEVLVEEFIEGRELTVGILANGNVMVLPILEIDFSDCAKSGEFFYSWRMKEFQGNNEMGLAPKFYCPARLSEELTKRVKETALKAHKALGCLDISRTDIRLGNDNIPYVLEVNPLPGLDPDESNFPMIAKAYKMEYRNLIKTILKSALERYEMAPFVNQKITERKVQAE